MSRPLVVVMDPQHADRTLEERLGRGAFAFAFVPYPVPGAPVDPALFARADAWLNYRGRHRLPGELLRRMERCRIVVNSGVGYDHVDVAVAAALRDGRLGGAGLDVLAHEPPAWDHPLLAAWRVGEEWLRNRLIVTPHAAFFTPESIEDKRRLTTTTALDYLRDGTLRACVNLELLKTRR